MFAAVCCYQVRLSAPHPPAADSSSTPPAASKPALRLTDALSVVALELEAEHLQFQIRRASRVTTLATDLLLSILPSFAMALE
jgi:hypothetical protein